MVEKKWIASEIIKQYMILQSMKIQLAHFSTNDDYQHTMELEIRAQSIHHRILKLALKLAKHFVEHSVDFADPYRYTIIVQFRSSSSVSLHDALNFKYSIEKTIGASLELSNLGICNGSQLGIKILNFHFSVSDVDKSVKTITETLINQELISWAKIASVKQTSSGWTLHYPEKGSFDVADFDV